MANAYIEEFERLATDAAGRPTQIGQQPSVTTQTVSFGAATQSSAFSGRTRFISITADGIFSFKLGSNPTATTSHPRRVAGTVEYLGVQPGDKVSFITNS